MMHSFLKTTFLILQNTAPFAPSIKTVILASTSIYASLQSHKLALNIVVLNLDFFAMCTASITIYFDPIFFQNLDG